MPSARALPTASGLTVAQLSRAWAPWLVIESGLLGLAGWHSFDNIFYDTVAYLRLAQHYLDGRLDLAISGYWGPMMSWAMVVPLALTHDHLLTTRIVMGLSALLFFWAALRLLRILALPAWGILAGAVLLVPISVCWSVQLATPDLLMSGLVLAGLGFTLGDDRNGGGRRPLLAGLIYGSAYLAKSVALPTALGLVGMLGVVRWLAGSASSRVIMRSVSWTVAGIALIVTPWVVVLSLHYGKPTFSTSAAIAHAIVGPDNPDRLHTLHHMFQAPEPGRFATWEDPSASPYPYWTPLRSADALLYQIKLVARNALEAATHIAGFDWLHIGLLSAIACLLVATRRGMDLRDQPWRLAAPAIAVVAAPYLPSYPDETRYYLVALPLLLAAALGFMLHDVVPAGATRRARLAALALIGVSFLAGLHLEILDAIEGATDPAYRTAEKIVPLLQGSEQPGPLLSVDDHSVAYFTAFLLGWPFYGDKITPTRLDEVLSSGARFLITRHETAFARALVANPSPNLERLPTDSKLPVAIYRIRPRGRPAG